MDILQDLEYEQPVSGMEEAISEHSADVPVGSLSRYVPWHRLGLCPSFPHLPRQQAPLLLEVPCMYPLSAPLHKGRPHGLFSSAVVRGAGGVGGWVGAPADDTAALPLPLTAWGCGFCNGHHLLIS